MAGPQLGREASAGRLSDARRPPGGVLDRGWPLPASSYALWQHPAIRQELVELLALLEDRAGLVPITLADALGWDAPVPLAVHSSYRLDDILAAFGLMTPDRPHRIREGKQFDPVTKTDLFFVTLQKTSITWRLRMPMPAGLFQQAKVAAG